MRAPIQGNDADIVDHLRHNREMIVGLNDLIVIVVERGQHRRSASNPRDTPLDGGHVLRAIVNMMAMILSIGFKFPLSFRRERRHSSILGVRDDGSALVWQGRPSVLFKRGVVIPYFTWPLRRLAVGCLYSFSRSLFKSLGFV